MPYRKFPEEIKKQVEDQLAAKLMDELSVPTESEVPDLVHHPLIIEHETSIKKIHFIVIWDDDDWRDLDLLRRSAVIMKALREKRDDVVMNVSVALGITSKEAPRFGINVEDVLEHGTRVSAKAV